MASQSIGVLIWLSFRPMLRLALCTLTGFMITKADLLPQVAARGAGQIALNICLPALFFSKIVPAFTPQNISNLGPLVLVGLLYQLIGLITCLIILPFFWVPHRFRWGFIAAGVWGNYSDLPTAVILSVTASAPFNGTEDQDLAVAYIAAFVIVFMITLFPMGGHHLVAMDFKGPEKEDEEIRRSFVEKSRESAIIFVRIAKIVFSYIRHKSERRRDDVEASSPVREKPEHSIPEKPSQKVGSQASKLGRPALPSRLTSSAPTTIVEDPSISDPLSDIRQTRSQYMPRSHKLRQAVVAFLRTLITIPTMTVTTALVISAIQPVKGLFVPLPTSPRAPDGQPPLAFIMDTTTFLGAASVPLGLICLGSALARLKLPKGEWRNMPIGAILALAVGRLVLQPVLGVLITQGLTNVGLISAEDKVLRFVCIFFSCVPTATTQVYLTQVYSGTGSAEHLPAFLIPQYFLMFISSTILTAYSLHLLFD